MVCQILSELLVVIKTVLHCMQIFSSRILVESSSTMRSPKPPSGPSLNLGCRRPTCRASSLNGWISAVRGSCVEVLPLWHLWELLHYLLACLTTALLIAVQTLVSVGSLLLLVGRICMCKHSIHMSWIRLREKHAAVSRRGLR